MKKLKVIGPSHVVRLENAYSLRSVALPPTVALFGIGGMPTWHYKFDAEFSNNSYDKLIIVGDFRFGNGYLDTGDESDITGIQKSSIKENVDMVCYEKTMQSLLTHEHTSATTVNFIFWDLAIREAKNKRDKKYFLKDGTYYHPIWNLTEVEKEFNGVITLAQLSPDKLISMCIDDSNHPSFLGYVFLSKLITAICIEEHAICSVQIYENSLKFIHENFIFDYMSCDVLGRSILQRFLKLSQDNGFSKKSINEPIGIKDLPKHLENNQNSSIYISNIKYNDDFEDLCLRINILDNILSKYNSAKVRIIFWDIYTRCVFEIRQKKNSSSVYIYIYRLLESHFKRFMIDLPYPGSTESYSLVELNKAGQPTFKMLNYLLADSPSYELFSVEFKYKINSMIG